MRVSFLHGGASWAAGCVVLIFGAAALAAPSLPDQTVLEAKFDAGVSSADQMQWLSRMASAPNHVGSPHDKENADFLLSSFKAWGWDARIERFDVLYPTPLSATIEMTAPKAIVLGGQEPPISGDALSQDLSRALPPYAAFQSDGDVTAPIVYVNYGLPDDYDALARRGISVKGKIVLARYGGGWRGIKPKLAQEHGAVGCIIYSDPADDGYARGDVYPKGGWRPDRSVQRGSVLDMPVRPGDPLTPGVGATPGAKRLPRDQAETIMKIPVLPLSSADAKVLMDDMDGPVAPPSWRGGLPLTYHIGGGDRVRVRLAVKSDWSLKPLYNVIAMLPGARHPDEWIVRGNHFDGWVFGASDPLSGTVALLSEAKALGSMYKAGWRPDRTIVYAAWDGEEPGLLGSTEWGEAHAAELKAKALLYVNSDSNARGFLMAGGSTTWQHLVGEVAADVVDPQTGASVASRWRAKTQTDDVDKTGAPSPTALAQADKGGDQPLDPLGSGSDWTVFLQHLGISSVMVGFGGEGEGFGSYHSAYDTYEHVVRHDDPGLVYGAVLAKTAGRIVLRAAQAPTPPRRFADFADSIARYVTEIRKLADDQRSAERKRQRLSGQFALAKDPARPVGPPVDKGPTPFAEMAALEAASDRLTTSAAAFDNAFNAKQARFSDDRRARVNKTLFDIDQLLNVETGLPGRPWYKNLVYAPGLSTGYSAKTLPGLREAIEERRAAEADAYARMTAAALSAYAARLDEARQLVDAPSQQ